MRLGKCFVNSLHVVVIILVFFIFYYCNFHYHQSSLNISMHVLSACTRYLRWLWYTVWSLYWKFQKRPRTTWSNMSCIFFWRILLFCWKKKSASRINQHITWTFMINVKFQNVEIWIKNRYISFCLLSGFSNTN